MRFLQVGAKSDGLSNDLVLVKVYPWLRWMQHDGD